LTTPKSLRKTKRPKKAKKTQNTKKTQKVPQKTQKDPKRPKKTNLGSGKYIILVFCEHLLKNLGVKNYVWNISHEGKVLLK
jgi:hypothetical protein